MAVREMLTRTLERARDGIQQALRMANALHSSPDRLQMSVALRANPVLALTVRQPRAVYIPSARQSWRITQHCS